jgi:group I intron endonuclease
VHIESGKSYVGSATNLSIRFKQYFNYNHLTYPKRNMIIYKALLKYGYAGFRLEILEYCAVEVLIKKEQFYFDTFNPEYNILKVAGSPLGYRHSEASKKLISIALKNIKVSESSRELKRKALLGKTFDKVRIEKMRLSNTLRKPVLVTNTETGEVQEFASIIDAGYYLRISKTTVRKYLLNNLTYNKYTISAKGPSLADKEISDESNPSKGGKISQQPVLVTNQKTGDKKEFSSMSEAAKYLGVSNGRL